MEFTLVKELVDECVICNNIIKGTHIRCYAPDSETTTFVCAHCADKIHVTILYSK